MKELAARGIRRVVALPLYPQFSQTTSATSLDELREFNERAGLDTLAVPSYPMLPEMIDAMMRRWEEAIADMAAWPRPIHVLLTAHGVPELYVRRGDPYITEVERTARAITERLPKDLPLNVAYQSRLGPVSWVKPYLDHEAARLASEGIRTLVMFPITFVSEHIETLYELDIQVADIAKAAGVEKVVRVATVQDHPRFIEGLARLTRAALDGAP
ncbi:ferrochelatase [bacterium]|nr:ferrochelatase [bacterium]